MECRNSPGNATPWQPQLGQHEDNIPVRVRLAEEGSNQPIFPNFDELAAPKPEIKRRARISRTDVIRIGFTVGCPGRKAISRGERESQNHTEECRTRIERALIEEGGIKAKRMTEGNQRYNEHKAKKTRAAEDGEQPNPKGTKRGTTETSIAFSSAGNSQGSERLEDHEHVKKYLRQEDEERNQRSEQQDVDMDFQPD